MEREIETDKNGEKRRIHMHTYTAELLSGLSLAFLNVII